MFFVASLKSQHRPSPSGSGSHLLITPLRQLLLSLFLWLHLWELRLPDTPVALESSSLGGLLDNTLPLYDAHRQYAPTKADNGKI